MYKNDKYNMTIVLLILGIGLLVSYALDMTNAVIVVMALIIFFVMQQFNHFEKRLQQLEQQYLANITPHSSRGWQWGIGLGALVGLVGTYLGLIPLLLVGIIGGVWCLLQILNSLNERLSRIEQVRQQPILQPPTDHEILEPKPVEKSDSVNSAHSTTITNSPEWFTTTSQSEKLSDSDLISTHSTTTLSTISTTKTAWWQPALKWFMHGNPILRVAIALLMIGVVLLLRFASEHWQLSLSIKLLGIALTGGGVTVLGLFLRNKNALFGIALQGAGLAVIFLTLIFAHHYAVIASLSGASVCFIILLIITVGLSLKQNAVYLSMLALSMAYLAPLVIPQYRPDSVFLMSYYLVINLAVAAMNFVKPWKILNQIAFFATGLIASSFIMLYADQAQYQTLDIILWLHILLFIWLSIRYSQLIQKEYRSFKAQAFNAQPILDSQTVELPPILDVGLIFSVPILGFSLHAFLMHQSSMALTWGALGLGILYTVLGIWIKQKQSELSILAKSFFILASVFIALVFPLWKGAHWTAVGWVIQGAALIVWGVSERYRTSRYLGMVLIFLSSIALFYQFWTDQQFPVLSTSIYAIAQFIAAYFLFKFTQKQSSYSVFATISLGLALYAGAVAVVNALAWLGHGLSSYLAVATILLLLFSGLMYFQSKIEWALAQLGLVSALLLLCYLELAESDVLSSSHWMNTTQQLSFFVTTIILSALLILLQKSAHLKYELRLYWGGLLWLSLAAIGCAVWPASGWLCLGIFPLIYGMWLFKQKQFILLDQISVWILSWLWLLHLNLIDQTFIGYDLPVFNPVDVMSLLCLAGLLWMIYQHNFNTQNQTVEWTFKVTGILTALMVLSSVVVRALHIYLATPLWSLSVWSNGIVQLSLTLLWVILAFVLMTYSSRRHIRQIWFVGAALLGIVVIKLVGLDLSQSGTLTRVVSFIGAGGVMLVIAYLAPLPPIGNGNTEKQNDGHK
ncbi:putative membrane protein [Acinetobacter baylyi]|uniref:Membrane protein n=1 Tax=Acinetobacter baylyi TaxID=202950 RepID=A0ABU0UWF6_ACIBI|nr:DUF2339 domain-containing protein [Acinetobacter baylyi]MDQ1208598.1 putative membrane protein [Acinetobacter baylyi]MDR6107811.1 putative membrane protein [Acinetobacter baylyi]MDR6185473.1 putative membrane protein [Acinetobacter baylyi]